MYKTLFLTLILFSAAHAQTPAPPKQVTTAMIFRSQMKGLEREVVPLVEAMPEDKFGFKPEGATFEKSRTFAQQATHLATVIYQCSSSLLGEKVPVEIGENENGASTLKSKADIVKYVKDAFAYAEKASASMSESNFTEPVQSPFGAGKMPRGYAAMINVWHSYDHYGQMVIYARLNGVVPPASRN